MRTVHIETTLPTDADRVWEAIQYPGTFLYVVRGLFRVPALEGRFDKFEAGEVGTAGLWAPLPLYRHTIEVLDVDHATRTITTHEHGGVIRSWNHTLHVESRCPDQSRYHDTIEIDAGGLTPIVALIAKGIFAYRSRRLRRLVRLHLTAAGPVYRR